MVDVITANNRANYREIVDAMHSDRKKIFVDTLNWSVPVVDGKYEIDQFDTDDAIYLVALDERKTRHLGSVRLLPTTKPHLMDTVFPMLCEQGVPRGEDIWEITRFCTSPLLRGKQTWMAQSYLAVAMVEFALLYGISHYTCLAETTFLSTVMAIGWECEPLGLPREINGETVGALRINISPATLQLFRQKMGWRYPVLEMAAIAKAA
jgi:N-acyl-L-homoserine lactone synthetase